MPKTDAPSRRFDLQVTHRYLLEHPALAIFCAAFLLAAAAASLAGLLRWQAAFARWSFSVLAAVAAIYCVTRALRGWSVNRSR